MINLIKMMICNHNWNEFSKTDYNAFKTPYDAIDIHLKCTKCGWRKNLYKGAHVPPHVRKLAYEGKLPLKEVPVKETAMTILKKRMTDLDAESHKIKLQEFWDYETTIRDHDYAIGGYLKHLKTEEENRKPASDPEPELIDLLQIFDSLHEYDVVIYCGSNIDDKKTMRVKAINTQEAEMFAKRDNLGWNVYSNSLVK